MAERDPLSAPNYEPESEYESDIDFADEHEHDHHRAGRPLLPNRPAPAFDADAGLPPPFNPDRVDIRRGDGWALGWFAAPQIWSIVFTAVVLISFRLLFFGNPHDRTECWFFFIFSLVAYFIEAFKSPELKYIRNIQSNERVRNYIEDMHRIKPKITWNVKCYHFEDRISHTRDSNGNEKEEVSSERVDTHSASAEYRFSNWRDVSGEMSGFGRNALTKIQFHKVFDFENERTKNDYNRRLEQFKKANNRDTHQDFNMEMSLRGFMDYVLQDLAPHDRPTHLNETTYWIATCCLMSAPFRIWFGSICGRTTHTFVKRITI